MSFSPNFRGTKANATSISSRSGSTNYVNGTGVQLNKATVVAVDSNGSLIKVNPSIESQVSAIIGVTGEDILASASGSVVHTGRLENISTTFAIGSPIYLDKNGDLIDVKPEIGISGFSIGDFVVFVGVIVKNEFNPLWKDLKVMLSVVGQL